MPELNDAAGGCGQQRVTRLFDLEATLSSLTLNPTRLVVPWHPQHPRPLSSPHVHSGAMLPLKRRFDLTSHQQEVVVSSTVLAALASSVWAGSTCLPRYGRRLTILGAAAVFATGSLVLLIAWDYNSLVLGRVVVGLGIGLASLTTPIYIAEVATPELRGQLVTINALLVTIGQFVAGMVDGILDQVLPNVGWRFMLGLAAVPSIIMFVGFLHMPESPRWLALRNRIDEARQVLRTLRESDDVADQELRDILESVQPHPHVGSTTDDNGGRGFGLELAGEGGGETDPTAEVPSSSATAAYGATADAPSSSSTRHPALVLSSPEGGAIHKFRSMWSDPPTRRALIVGCGLMAVQQCSGINTVRSGIY